MYLILKIYALRFAVNGDTMENVECISYMIFFFKRQVKLSKNVKMLLKLCSFV